LTPDINHNAQILQLPSRTELLNDMRRFVSDAARRFGFSEIEVGKIELAIDEACTNIIKHAYRYNPDGIIEIRISSQGANNNQPGKFIVEIHDNGQPFDASHYSAPDMKEYFKKLRHGGLGIVLMKKLMDEVEYNTRSGPHNTIRLVKYLAN
jgi:serine/threonine-protein kinase RsbW